MQQLTKQRNILANFLQHISFSRVGAGEMIHFIRPRDIADWLVPSPLAVPSAYGLRQVPMFYHLI
jgi:hypothetical protein